MLVDKLNATIKILTVYLLSLFLLPGALQAEDKYVDSDIVAKVNGNPITADMINFLSASRQQGPLSGLDPGKTILLENLITTELLFHQAKQTKLEDNHQISLELELAHKTLLSQLYVKHFLEQLAIDEATLRAAYDAQSSQVMVQMELRHFDTEAAAQAFLHEVKKDPTENNTGGEVQAWQRLADYSFAQLPEASSLSSGQWLSVPIESNAGWQVWRCLEKSAIPKPSYELSKEGLRQELASQHLQQHIASLHSDAKIDVYMQD